MLAARLPSPLRTPARKCLGILRRTWGPKRPAPITSEEAGKDTTPTPFMCNVCGRPNRLPAWRLTREDGPCVGCQCHGRLRSISYAVTAHFSPEQLVLAWMRPRKEIRGLGCSDWGYADLLAEKFNYVNTFYDRPPQLDLSQVDWTRWPPASFDFITCSDVLEHVVGPIEATFENMRKLLRPGGVMILTVPTSLEPNSREHFPALYDWRIDEAGGARILINRRQDGVTEQFEDLCFHGGEGLTLEFRFFSRQGLIRSLRSAGFQVARIYEQSLPEFAIPLGCHNFVLVAQA